MRRPSEVYFVSHQRLLSRGLTHSYLHIRKVILTNYKRWIKFESKRPTWQEQVLLSRDGGGLTQESKGRGQTLWDILDNKMERTRLECLALMNKKPDPLKQISFVSITLFFPKCYLFLDWLRFPKDIVLAYTLCIYINIFLCHSLLSIARPYQKA